MCIPRESLVGDTANLVSILCTCRLLEQIMRIADALCSMIDYEGTVTTLCVQAFGRMPPQTAPTSRASLLDQGARCAVFWTPWPGAHPGSVNWPQLRCQRAQVLRTALAAQHAPSPANKMLVALRGIIRQSWRPGWMEFPVRHCSVCTLRQS